MYVPKALVMALSLCRLHFIFPLKIALRYFMLFTKGYSVCLIAVHPQRR
jgi:hypothetical protein